MRGERGLRRYLRRQGALLFGRAPTEAQERVPCAAQDRAGGEQRLYRVRHSGSCVKRFPTEFPF